MAIIPEREETLIRVFRCPVCKEVYQAQTGPIQLSCSVRHAPGTCCHYMESTVTAGKLKAVIKALGA